MRWSSIAILSVFLGGCMGGGGATPPQRASAASIEYRLPVTTAKLTLDLTLQSCVSGPVATGRMTVTPIANPGTLPQERYRLYGANLASFTRNRKVGIELYPHGAIKSINGEVADRTGAIIANVLKIAAGAVGIFGAPDTGGDPLSGVCNSDTLQALAEVDALEQRITDLRRQLPTLSALEADAARSAIDALAVEVARLRTGPLNLKLEREIGFRRGNPEVQGWGARNSPGGRIHWTAAELRKWLVVPQNPAPTELFSISYCTNPVEPPPTIGCTTTIADEYLRNEQAIASQPAYAPSPPCFNADVQTSCPTSLIFREPVTANLVVISSSGNLQNAPRDRQLARQELFISQWGDVAELRLSVGFGGSFAMASGFNEFGRRSSFSWSSGARGEGITGGISGIVDAAGTLRNAFDTELEEQQQEINRLKTQQELNRLDFCRSVIEAGGFNCPTS